MTVVFGVIAAFILSAVVVLKVVDLVRKPATGGQESTARKIARVPVFLLGLSAVGIGILLAGWVLFNVFVERQKEFHLGVDVTLPFIMIAFGVRMMKVSLNPPEPTKTPDEQARPAPIEPD